MTSPVQLPPVPDLPADARGRMRARLIAEVTGAAVTGRSRSWTAPAAVAACVLLAAGGLTAARAFTGSPASVPGVDSGPTATAAPAATDCGTFTLAQGERLPESAVRCLTTAAAEGRPATLQQTRPSAEGAPIVTTYFVEDRGRVRVVTDARADPNGTGGVHRQSCTRLTQVDGRLVTDGCSAGGGN